MRSDAEGQPFRSETPRAGAHEARDSIGLGLPDGIPTIGFNPDTFEEDQSSKFTYEPEKIDVVYLEFIAAIELILSSPEVSALREAIAKDLGVVD
ncbi:hypothetical protein [Bordetella petrii]|uniref:hypothetical protein n=1 Tax=Bordetella petrii TaxID=94624 RepID=UPI001A96D50A|nr:hypothetical protein [Bordetella petrii]MBO1114260.1 hypothetical protein [Bordetella petrii]